VGPRTDLSALENTKTYFFLPCIEPRFLGRPGCSLVSVVTMAPIQSACTLPEVTVLQLLETGFNNLVRRLWTLARFAVLM
jgi:hypothetical protein